MKGKQWKGTRIFLEDWKDSCEHIEVWIEKLQRKTLWDLQEKIALKISIIHEELFPS